MNLFSNEGYRRLDKRIATVIEDGLVEVEISATIKNNLRFKLAKVRDLKYKHTHFFYSYFRLYVSDWEKIL